MLKILIIPDTHGRDFWKQAINSDADKIIFLGDYLDPYSGEATKEEAIENFKEILEFRREHGDKVIMLLGNHDLGYYDNHMYADVDYWCRHDHENHEEIAKLFQDNKDYFKLHYICDNFCKGINKEKILFTHAGFNNYYYKLVSDIFGNDIDNICSELMTDLRGLWCVGYVRGGEQPKGSIIWSDVREHGETPNKYLMPYFQVFGHTYCRKEIIRDDFAMLDCGKKCFVIDENELYGL